LAEALNAAAWVAIGRGSLAEAIELAGEAERLATEAKVSQPTIVALTTQAEAHHRLGAPEIGRTAARRAYDEAMAHGFAYFAARAARWTD
jgi:ATP/maltotriose-dependent transcriptional regulator MalT